MDPATLGGASTVIGGIALMLMVISASLLLGFLLFISPLMIWLNIRRLRLDLHADLAALRESVERVAGAREVLEPEPEPEEPATEESAVPPEVPVRPPEDKIGFSCPECGKFFEGPSTLAGSNFTCPECRVEFHIH